MFLVERPGVAISQEGLAEDMPRPRRPELLSAVLLMEIVRGGYGARLGASTDTPHELQMVPRTPKIKAFCLNLGDLSRVP